jgi:hypothetical protein
VKFHPGAFYSGVGARETPYHVCELFKVIAARLSATHTLRSGGAKGADQAFEAGCTGPKEIYLPYSGFEGNKSPLTGYAHEAVQMFEDIFGWVPSAKATRNLLFRDVYQVLGADLKTPSQFLICWTRDALPIGGTQYGIGIAEAWGIPVYNAGNDEGFERLFESFC